MTLVEFQTAFWRDLWAEADDRARPEGPAAQPGFAVYRNTVLKGCAEALVSLYPAVHRLVGDDWMRAVALDAARAAPPAGGDLQHYGVHFPAFLDQALVGGDWPWLGEVARLDRLWSECHVAADAPVLDLHTIAALDPARLATARLVPHPAARWRWCADWPAFSLWQAARTAAADPNPPLLEACAAGQPLGEALDAVQARHACFDPGASLGRLLQQGAFAALTEMPS